MAIKVKGSTVIDVVGGSFKGTFKHVTSQGITESTLLGLTAATGEVYYVTDKGGLAAWNGSSWVYI